MSWVPLSTVCSRPSFERMYWPGVAGPTRTSTMYRAPWMGWAWSAGTMMRAQGVPSGRTSSLLLLARQLGLP